MNRARHAILAGLCMWSVSAAPAYAQTPGGEGRVEVAFGAVWTGNASFGSQAATETRGSGDRFQLFSTSTTLGAAAGIEATVGVRLSSSLEAEASASFGRPTLRTLIGGDVEGAADVTIGETIQRYNIVGGIRWQLPRWKLRRGVPFVTAGAGYLRELHEGGTLAEAGQTYHGGLGVRFLLRSGDGRLKAAGIRAEARIVLRRKGAGLDSDVHPFPALGASAFFRF